MQRSRLMVGGCKGGDCLVAQEAIRLGHEVHTVLPTLWGQLCDHWKAFVYGYVGHTTAPHTTSWEQMKPGDMEPYRARNERIIALSSELLAFPNVQEQEARSGTTMTINIARRTGIPVAVHILHPAGVVHG